MQCSILGWILDWEKITTNGVLGTVAAAVKLLQSCPTLWDPIDGSPPGPAVPGFSRQNTGVGCHFLLQGVKVKSISHVRLFATPWIVAHQAPPSMGFSRQEYWSGLPLPFPWGQLEKLKYGLDVISQSSFMGLMMVLCTSMSYS